MPVLKGMRPAEIVQKLDQFIIGQTDAKKSVAVALRNRERRLALGDDPIKDEIHPKNIIMIGPTGVGKTEIARRMASLANAPFLKVEATKFTEVGYVGRDVESMVRDLLSFAIKMVKTEREEIAEEEAAIKTEERIVDILTASTSASASEDDNSVRDLFLKKLKSGQFEDKEIELKATAKKNVPNMQILQIPGMEDMENQMQNLFKGLMPKKQENIKLSVSEARKIIHEEELENLIDTDSVTLEAIKRTEERGVIFIDEIDKIASRQGHASGEISREGVQRDILPLVEGSTVNTRNGSVKTDHILFIAAGAFHTSKVSDLIPELQGRFPIRVELKPLEKKDYQLIVSQPRNALSKQYEALLSTENIVLTFKTDAYEAIAEIAHEVNSKHENIGARRLHTIMEKLVDIISFSPEEYEGKEITVDRKFVESQLDSILQSQNLSNFIL
jgi:ATP-dependent HslUV protease ATP-binding subunit HslU